MNKNMYIDMHQNQVWTEHKNINNGYTWMVRL